MTYITTRPSNTIIDCFVNVSRSAQVRSQLNHEGDTCVPTNNFSVYDGICTVSSDLALCGIKGISEPGRGRLPTEHLFLQKTLYGL